MGNELWVSSLTGYRRKGTRFTDLKQMFVDNITARCIYEPLLCCPINSFSRDAKEVLQVRNFDLAGVKALKDSEVIGYVVTEEIGKGEFKNYIKRIEQKLLISDSTPLAEIFSVLSENGFVFILHGKKIAGIITKADINKPPVRIYIFGMISLLELHLNFWINYYYKKDSWVSEIFKKRMEEAQKEYKKRKKNNQELTRLECLQFCDKREILAKKIEFIRKFKFSKNIFKSLMKHAEKIRNNLAHSQKSITDSIDWKKLIGTMANIEKFLIESDNEVERIAKSGSEFQDLLI